MYLHQSHDDSVHLCGVSSSEKNNPKAAQHDRGVLLQKHTECQGRFDFVVLRAHKRLSSLCPQLQHSFQEFIGR